MATGARMRASDQDRDEAVLALREHHAQGRIDIEEFTARMEQAQTATFIDEFDPLFEDLPARRAKLPVRPPERRMHRFGRPRAAVFLLAATLVALSVLALAHGHFFPIWAPLVILWVLAVRRRRWQAFDGYYRPAPHPGGNQWAGGQWTRSRREPRPWR
jgi:Domain of unknown function (DUF1707)